MSNFDASALQRQLILHKDKDGNPYLAEKDPNTGLSNVDGVFGTVTQAALIKFQDENNLDETGQPDDRTMIALGLKTQPPAVVKWSLPSFSIPAIFSDYILNYITSKVNWASTAGAVIIIGVLNDLLGKVGIQLDSQATVALSAFLLAILNGVVVPILRTFFNKPKVIDGKALPTT